MKRLYMETTKIPAEQTAAQISARLGKAGALAVLTEYGPDRQVTALSFQLLVGGRRVPFRLPVRSEPIYRILHSRRKYEDEYVGPDHEQAERVAWRLCLRWLEAQLAYVETEQVNLEEVMLPYVQVASGQTIYESLAAVNFDTSRMLPAPQREVREG